MRRSDDKLNGSRLSPRSLIARLSKSERTQRRMSQAELESELARIAQAFRLHSPGTLSFADGPVIDAAERVRNYPEAEVDSAEDPLVVVVRRVVYFQCFVRRLRGTISTAQQPDPNLSDDEFVHGLSQANQSQSRWDPFWQVYRTGVDGEVQVQKDERRQFPVPGEFSFDAGPGVRPVEGDHVSLLVLPESLRFQPGYYFCFGEEIGDQFDDFSKVRFYFNLQPTDAAPLIEFLSRELNRFQVPFRMKCPASPENFDRIDTAVLYVSSRWLQITEQIIGELARDILPHLEPEVPLFCRTLWPGIGFAEDPEDRRSFGENRCRLVGEAIVQAWQEAPEPSADRFVQAIRKRFKECGLSLTHPWLNAGSVDTSEPVSSVEVRL